MNDYEDNPEGKTAIALLMDGVCQALVDGNRPAFVKAAHELKSRFPLNDEYINPYNMMPGYSNELKTILDTLRDPEILGWFAEELVLPTTVALELAKSTRGMDEQILHAVALDRAMHEIEKMVQLKGGENFPIFDLTCTLRLIRLFMAKDSSCELLGKGIALLLSNPEINTSDIEPEDLIALDTHHEITHAMKDTPALRSPLAVIKHHDARFKEILEEREMFFSRASKVAKVPNAFVCRPPKVISVDPINRLLQYGMTKTASAMIERSMLQLDNYQQAKDLLDAMPGLSEKTLQATFLNLMNQNPMQPTKPDLRYYFFIAQERNFNLKMAPEKYQVGYFLDGFESYLSDRGNHPKTVEWGIPFFDQALSTVPDNLIKQYRIKDFAPAVVANHCNRLKRLSLEQDLGM
jgi:hypothetical protein